MGIFIYCFATLVNLVIHDFTVIDYSTTPVADTVLI